ncbi:GSCFA domain-containing protein [Flavobacterium sp. LS1P28]|uniref:GSCFA domain-containing protein n=1 Tax=unclassified Flavobacterium TaxID=196869 RepID=UPI000F818F1F|nr:MULTISPECIES: GSCFA domain-containing protein [unclassified Flavobacterium]RTY68910.1 GSCFA domain-containing protein [Flavobacterium sp. LB2P53]RTY73786.1 GSCFA domain-containing protein [Flavobacterium sp. LS1R10]RTY80566.1 GSCFA domain-containing protein [Flavobacterium sp. LS1P28]RTZ05352.1 GSCFA domain-containing protein [Flavobacterium sp. GSP6]
MNFRTQVPIPKSKFPIDYTSKIMSLGSCFAVNMAQKLDYFKFQNSCNPFGILFHPIAIEKLVDFAVSGKQLTESDIFFYNERWHCFDVHSDLSSSSKEELLASLNAILIATKLQLQHVSHIIITYGTSWVYRNIESNCVVANCHKVPQKLFQKELLSVEEIEESIVKTLKLIHVVNPSCTIIFTVSPVRHIKDGFVENQWSKANIISALHGTFDFRLSTINYFPSYEIMMDELRDYRFYTEDMLHPNPVAIDYIWKRFKETIISETAFATMDEVSTIQKSLSHKPFNPKSESHLKFESKVREKITKLESEYSFMKF